MKIISNWLNGIYKVYEHNFHLLFLIIVINVGAIVSSRFVPYLNIFGAELLSFVFLIDWLVFIKKFQPSIKTLYKIMIFILVITFLMSVLSISLFKTWLGVVLLVVIISIIVKASDGD